MWLKFIRNSYFERRISAASLLLCSTRLHLTGAVTPSELALVCATQWLLWNQLPLDWTWDLFPFVSALWVHERHLNVVPSVGLVVTVPLQPPVHLSAQVIAHCLLCLLGPLLPHKRLSCGSKKIIWLYNIFFQRLPPIKFATTLESVSM